VTRAAAGTSPASHFNQKLIDRLEHVPPICAGVVGIIAALSLVGWALQSAELRSFGQPVSMNPMTAVAFLMCALSLWLLGPRETPEPWRLIARGLAIVAGLIGAYRVLDYLLHFPWHIDRLLFPARLEDNKMAPNTAGCFVLAGVALALMDERIFRRRSLNNLFALATLAIALLGLTGYFYGTQRLYQVGHAIPMALNTSIAFLLLASGIICARPEREPLATVASNTAGGAMARRILPAAVLLPLILGWLRLRGEQMDLYDREVGVAVFALMAVVIFSMLIWWSARLLYVVDAERRDAEHQLLVRNRELEHLAARLTRSEESLRVAKDAAESASRAKSNFLANMSHELRTPLNAIIGYSEMLEEEATGRGEEQTVGDLKKINAAGTHLLALINEILDLSKIEAGKTTLHLEEFSVAALVRDVVTTVRPLVEKNGNELVTDVSRDAATMRADLTKVRQCLLNLLSNATKFTERGRISVKVSREPDQQGAHEVIVFTIADTGIGMNREQVEGLFQAFTQADTSTAARFGGSGLGLAISRQFARLMGGDLTADSRPSEGSTFTLRLPAQVMLPRDYRRTSIELQAQERDARPPESAPSAGTILVIDDDPASRELLARSLRGDGFEVLTAEGGEEGLRIARDRDESQPLAAITLDVMMPGMDGWAVLSALKADPRTADIPVLLVTMLSDDSRELGYALGASEYLTKPIDRARLSAVLNRYCREHADCLVLLVEDDPAARDVITRTLKSEGYPIREAGNGQAALDLLRTVSPRPALILLDLMMPQMDGFDFLIELRRSPAWRDIPVVVVTAKELLPEDHARLNGYVQAILHKAAYSRQDLLREVEELVKSRGRGAAL
jgi:signal transduction histidine kinase/CheY-like chemotaxis protein